MPLAREISRLLAMRAASKMPEVWECSVEELRANVDSRVALSGKPEEILSREERRIDVDGGTIPVRVFRPLEDTPLPCIVFFHGGGWVHNTLDIYESSLRALANASGYAIVAVEYRKAPEHPYPIPLEDCWTALHWCIAHADELGIDTGRIGLMGDSSGGNLAAAVALRARGVMPLAFQVLIYPCLDPRLETASAEEFASGFNLAKQGMQWYWEQYTPNAEDRLREDVAPVYARDVTHLPRTFIAVAENDILRDDGRYYHELLLSGGVQSTCREYEGMIHGFFTYGAITPMYRTLVDEVAEWVNDGHDVS
jgi:acetyl esterase